MSFNASQAKPNFRHAVDLPPPYADDYSLTGKSMLPRHARRVKWLAAKPSSHLDEKVLKYRYNTLRGAVMYERITLPNGARIVCEHMDAVRSASLGIWVGAGS